MQQFDSGLAIDAPVQILARNMVLRMRQRVQPFIDRGEPVGVSGIKSGEREENVAFERRSLAIRKGEFDPVIGGPLADHRLRAEQRQDRKFDPARGPPKIAIDGVV